MDFQRARSQEQKDKRLDEIIDVACDQYARLSYDKISMASIAKELTFTRGNLYTYAATKEEIFLLVLIEDQRMWAGDIVNELKGRENMDIEDFAKLWAKVYYRHKRLLSLYSLMYSIIEKNVSVEKLTKFKQEFTGAALTVYDTLSKALPFLTQEMLYKFFMTQFHFLRGFYPATQDTEVQRQAIKKSGIPYVVPDFEGEFAEFVVMCLQSLKTH